MLETIFILVGFLLLAVKLLVVVASYLYDNSPEEKNRKAQAAITVSVTFDLTTKCSPAHPLHVTITNSSSRVLNRIIFSFEAYRPGYSSNLAEWETCDCDKILSPGSSYSFCNRAPKIREAAKGEELVWRVRPYSLIWAS